MPTERAVPRGVNGSSPRRAERSGRPRLGAAARLASVPLAGAGLLLATAGLPDTLPARPRLLVVDLHVDQPYQVHYRGRDADLHDGHASVDALKKGAYGGVVFAIYLPDRESIVGRQLKRGPTLRDAEGILTSIETIVKRTGAFLPLGQPLADGQRIVSFLSIEGAGAFADDLEQLDRFIARGVRLVGPVHANDNALSTSATGKKAGGLTEKGKAFCRRVYERGALVDISHMSDEGVRDLVPIAKEWGAPLVATHSNARKIAGHARNLTDDQIKAVAASGGVIGLNFHASFVRTGGGEATLVDVLRHAEHILALAGVEHLAIGSDFDGSSPARGLEDASTLPELAKRLEQRGLTHDQVLKIFSQNALRVLAWRPPRELERRIAEAKARSSSSPP